jgi:hypothetical protein
LKGIGQGTPFFAGLVGILFGIVTFAWLYPDINNWAYRSPVGVVALAGLYVFPFVLAWFLVNYEKRSKK